MTKNNPTYNTNPQQITNTSNICTKKTNASENVAHHRKNEEYNRKRKRMSSSFQKENVFFRVITYTAGRNSILPSR